MKSICRSTLITLLVCALPTMAIAAETTPAADRQPPASLQPAPQAAPAPAEKSADLPKTQPSAVPTAPKGDESPATKAAIRIGYVDMIRVSTDSEPGKAGQDRLTEKKKKLLAQIENRRKQLDKQRAAIEAKLPTFTPQQRETKGKEFQKKVEEYQKFTQKAEVELQDLQQEQSRILYEKIEKAATDYGKKNGLTFVAVKRDLLYLAEGVETQDVTEGIVKLVNEQGQKK